MCDFCLKEGDDYQMCQECYDTFWLADLLRFVLNRFPKWLSEQVFATLDLFKNLTSHYCRYEAFEIISKQYERDKWVVTAFEYRCRCGRVITAPTKTGILYLQSGMSEKEVYESKLFTKGGDASGE